MSPIKTNYMEEWIKITDDNIPKGDYVVVNFVQNSNHTKISLSDGKYTVLVIFNGIPILTQNTIEGIRMRTWGNAQLKYNKYMFRESFLFEIKNSNLIKWCVQESCGFYKESQLKHYCIVTCEELVDIVSTFDPIIQKVM